MNTKIPSVVTVGPEVWPGKELRIQPGDLSHWAPGGLGLGAPMMVRPWDRLEDAMNSGQYYGFEPHSSHPLLGAPTTSAAGGTVYFDDGISQEAFQTLLRILQIRDYSQDYAVFLAESANPQEERFLVQMRIVTKFALTSMFGAEQTDDSEKLITQPLTIWELMEQFWQDQRDVWGEGYSHALSGCMGGDGDWAKETLSFGLFVENSYQGVYRLWSRAWLVTK